MKALRVEIEGLDGSGKTTALKYVVKKLQDNKERVLSTCEVGSPLIPTSLKLREIVLSPDANMTGEAMEFVFAAMRLLNDSFYKKIETEYDFVVSDRGWLSHLAYTDHNASEDFTRKFYLNLVANITELPDVIIYLSINAETSAERIKRRGANTDSIEQKGIAFQQKVRASFLKYIDMLSSDVDVFFIDANRDLENVNRQLDSVINVLSARANLRKNTEKNIIL